MMYRHLMMGLCLFFLTMPLHAQGVQPRHLEADLLVFGGNESAVAAAVQASRLGVKRVVLVNDIDWLGGQFSAEGCGAIDEWTTLNGNRVEFPRSGMFLEVANAIERINKEKYGTRQPGNCFCARLTIEPKEGARIFAELVAPEVKSGRLIIERGWEPDQVTLEGKRITSVHFQKGAQELIVTARLTIDASDWGDVIRLSGAKYLAGPDPKSRFDEPSAPAEINEANRREMNPLTYCVTLRGSASVKTIPMPPGFERRNFLGSSRETIKEFEAIGWTKGALKMNTPIFADTQHLSGPYSPPVNIYTHRRLVDAVHLKRNFAEECLFMNWPTQDYPLDQWPQSVVVELEKSEPGAGKKNIVDMKPSQRRIVLADAKRHTLGLLHHLQRLNPEFRKLELSKEYGTADSLPWKPYIREGMRLEALTMLREQDLRTPHTEPKWAKLMPQDGLFGFQFNIDFHPTRRLFLNNDPAGPWVTIHTATRNWNTHTDRSMFPLSGLIPIEREGLLGASKNIGVSSIVSSALRLQGQMMLCGQASGTVAYVALRDRVEPREIAQDSSKVLEVQKLLLNGTNKPGVLIWPYHDLPPDHPAFIAANLATIRGLWKPDPKSVLFEAEKSVTAEEWATIQSRLPQELRKKWMNQPKPLNRAEAVKWLIESIPD
jgi:hypothetical protein